MKTKIGIALIIMAALSFIFGMIIEIFGFYTAFARGPVSGLPIVYFGQIFVVATLIFGRLSILFL